jgi:hypothetical protein
MIFRIEAFASLNAGKMLKINIITNAEKSHAEISSIVVVVIKGLAIRISVVIIIPNDIPMPKL